MKKGAYQQLNLTHLEAALPQVLQAAQREQWTYETFLERALASELEGREQQAMARRLKAARIPSPQDAGWVRFLVPTDALGAQTAGTGGSLVCADLHQYRVPWSSRNRENASESGTCRSGAHRRPLGAVYDVGRTGTNPGERFPSRASRASACVATLPPVYWSSTRWATPGSRKSRLITSSSWSPPAMSMARSS